VTVSDRDITPERRAVGAFMEAYFSNFIEGTEFAVQEAVEIVFDGKMPDARPEDGRDVLGVYLQLVDLRPRPAAPIEPDKFIDEIRERHRQLMQGRPSVRPGVFKEKPNKAGDTIFVAPNLVEGTIREGINILRVLSDPFSRALFLHFLLSDVHPFNDGNGRLSRIMMTKELVSAGLSRIVVPTVYRNDYLDALRAMSRRSEPSIFVRSMEFCQRVSAACSEDSVDKAIDTWARAYAFCEDGHHAKLTMPNPDLAIETRQGTPAPVDYWLSTEQEHAGSLKL
jgi:fido (protein-threonine AMPylation protein)